MTRWLVTIVASLAAALAMSGTALASSWGWRSWNLLWPSRLSGGASYVLYAPPAYDVEVDLDGYVLDSGVWNNLDCGSWASSAHAYLSVSYTSSWTRIYVRLKSGWFCDEPRAGMWSRLVVQDLD